MIKISSTVKPSNNSSPPSPRWAHSDGGFSLIEVLVSLLLVALLGYVVTSGVSFFPDHLVDAVDTLERDFRFASNESVLRSSMVRARLNLSQIPSQHIVEYGPKQGFVLPQVEEEGILTIQERERLAELQAKIDQQFQPVGEYQEGPRDFSQNVTLLGVANGLKGGELIVDREASIYFYPTGERDNALILLTNGREIATLELLPFTEKITRNYYTLSEQQQNDETALLERAREIYEEWLDQ